MLDLLEEKEKIKLSMCYAIQIFGKEEMDVDFFMTHLNYLLAHSQIKVKSKKSILRYMNELVEDITKSHLNSSIPLRFDDNRLYININKPILMTHLIVYYLHNSLKYLILFHSFVGRANNAQAMLEEIETDDFSYLPQEIYIETTEVTLRNKLKALNKILALHGFQLDNSYHFVGREINVRMFFYELYFFFMNGVLQSKSYLDTKFGEFIHQTLQEGRDLLEKITVCEQPTENERMGFAIIYGISVLRAMQNYTLSECEIYSSFSKEEFQDKQIQEMFITIKKDFLKRGFSVEVAESESRFLLAYLYTELPRFHLDGKKLFKDIFQMKVNNLWGEFLDFFEQYFDKPFQVQHSILLKEDFKRNFTRFLFFENLGLQRLIAVNYFEDSYRFMTRVLEEFSKRIFQILYPKREESYQKPYVSCYFIYLNYAYCYRILTNIENGEHLFPYFPKVNAVIDFAGTQEKGRYVHLILEKRYGLNLNLQEHTTEETDIVISNILTNDFENTNISTYLWSAFFTDEMIEILAKRIDAIQNEKRRGAN
ncbi:Mga helix-turn-helix domain-containing protein [Pilibacter termitis]|uniref:Mga helix-turn-helix domain-containing protein n=2 Tax=Pilibacter termitis TaxID=263852 RepID=A0A1T4L5M3_9ENTE|nr:Mga helix-turn-helix domain-containing protein [Pilibacter termitis]